MSLTDCRDVHGLYIASSIAGFLYHVCGLQEALFQLLRIAGLLESLPLPPRSPHADMVAASISQRATLQEREVSSSPLWLPVMFCKIKTNA